MDPKDLSNLTIYSDLMDILKEKGMTDVEASDVVLKLTSQVEAEVVEELMSGLSDEQLKMLDDMPDSISSEEIAQKMGFEAQKIQEIREKKAAELIEELIPTLDKEDEEATEETAS